ncbi:MAG TPA: TlpA disulfide reductase family protein, partial [Gaiellales bacterium]|nr:TlpA disulfide reductase family protein [Gaiellales bacterium]
ESKPASDVQSPAGPDLLPVGSIAPDFTLRTPEGSAVTLSRLRGRAVLLEFFATWCPHCQAEAPHLRRLALRLGTADYAFVSVNGDGETGPSVYAFHRYFGLPYPALLDPGTRPGSFTSAGAPGRVTGRYGVQAFPTFYILDRAGRIVWRSDGEQPDAFLLQQLRRAATG